MAAVSPIQATDNLPINSEVEKVELTELQKSELAAIHKEIFEKKKELVNKHVEFGLIPKEKGARIISKMEKRYNNIDDQGLMPQWHKLKDRY